MKRFSAELTGTGYEPLGEEEKEEQAHETDLFRRHLLLRGNREQREPDSRLASVEVAAHTMRD
jgi:hypothetical protein